jgi:hypothetical protein
MRTLSMQTVWLERLANRPMRPYVEGDALDKAVSELLQACICQPQMKVIRVEEGKYRVGDDPKILLLRVMRTVSRTLNYSLSLPTRVTCC